MSISVDACLVNFCVFLTLFVTRALFFNACLFVKAFVGDPLHFGTDPDGDLDPRIRTGIRILESVPLTNGSGCGSGRPKTSRNQVFSYYLCLIM